MENFKLIPGGICAPPVSPPPVCIAASGITIPSWTWHLSRRTSAAPVPAATPPTRVYGAPITVDREHLKDGYAQAIVVNSGNANTCAPNGIELAKETCEIVAKELGISADDVLPLLHRRHRPGHEH